MTDGNFKTFFEDISKKTDVALTGTENNNCFDERHNRLWKYLLNWVSNFKFVP